MAVNEGPHKDRNTGMCVGGVASEWKSCKNKTKVKAFPHDLIIT